MKFKKLSCILDLEELKKKIHFLDLVSVKAVRMKKDEWFLLIQNCRTAKKLRGKAFEAPT